jgi:transposase, IS5 family
VKLRILEIGRIARTRGGPNRERLQQGYEKLLSIVGRVVGQAKRFSSEIAEGVKQSADVMQQAALEGLRKELQTFVPRLQQVIRQTKERIFGGNTHVADKLFSIFEPATEIIRKGKASKPNEFGKMVKIQEGENQIIVDYKVYEERPSDSSLVISGLDAHEQKLGCIPRLVAGDAAFYSARNEAAAHERGVKRVCIPSRSTKSAERKREQKKRWFKQGQKWRTGCEGRISVLKRRHGLRRCLYRGEAGMKRWVGLGVIADNLHHLGTVLAERKN